jgi:triacylglycerol lipase
MNGGDNKVTGPRPRFQLGRRSLLTGAAALAPALAFGQQPEGQQPQRRAADAGGTPIVFVHGNGDSAALWINNLWRFESNGFKRNQLFPISLSHPSARTDDAKPQDNRSSTEDVMKELAAYVAQVKKTTRQSKVVLIANSRGGNTVRNYLKNGGGASSTSHAILGSGIGRGIWISDTYLPGSEFNGAAPFLKGLNAGPDDRIAGVEMMAIRSDKNDKYAQPDGRFIGQPGKPTGVSYDASELRGCKTVVLDGLDHREVAFHKLAFAAQFEFITGKPPATLFIAPEPLPVLNGKVTGVGADGAYTNLPVSGADVEIHEVDPHSGERRSTKPAHKKTTGADGQWGPFIGHSEMAYEFVVTMEGQPITHTYRSPFLRGCDFIDLRPQPFGKGDTEAGAVVIMSRPRGYFGVGRDKFSLDGKVPPGINDGVPGASTGKLAFDAAQRTVMAVFNTETIAARTWPAKDSHIVVAEFTN